MAQIVMPTRPARVGILLFPGVEELDFAGPYEVFAHARDAAGAPYCTVTTVGTAEQIPCEGGLCVLCDVTLHQCPPLDLLVVPGGPAARENPWDALVRGFLRDQRAQVPTIASVCTGAFYLAGAGLLDGRRATTHPRRLLLLEQQFPQVEVVCEKLVDGGDIVTAGGISSGIDLALHFLEKWFGAEARQHEAQRLDGPWH